MGKSLSYEMLRGVRLAWASYCCLPYPLPVCLRWFTGLELLVESFLTFRLVTRINWVAVRTLSSSLEYLFARLNKLSIVAEGFLTRGSNKGVPEQILLLKIWRTTSMLQDSTWSMTCLNLFTNSLNDSFSCIFMFCKVLMFCLCCVEHRNCPTKASDISQKLFTEFNEKWWNHERDWS